MKNFFALLICWTVIPAFAFDSILLQCTVNGSIRIGGESRQVSETLEIDVYEINKQSILEINGPTIKGFFNGRSFIGKSGTQFTAQNLSSPDAWEFAEKTVSPSGRSSSNSVRIDRRTGSFSYSEATTSSNGHAMYISASGTCSKRSTAKKF